MKRPTPDELDRMSPREAFTAGDAYGREQLVEAMRRDQHAAAAAQSVEAQAKLEERLAGMERAIGVLQCDAEDRAKAIVNLNRRVTDLEGGKVC